MQETQHVPAEPAPGHEATPGPASGSHPYADEIDAEDLAPRPLTPQSQRRMLLGIAVIVAIGLTAVLPPLINVNRYQRRIATSISASLGRPVHLDSVSLNLLPTPGFTLTNFNVSEDPAFGSEPVIRANTVTATLRMRSLWHRRVEFSKIALDEPSVNLVHRADGQWNIESILLQASRMPVIPTEQTPVSGAQRFPYIEATGARVNFKQGLEKKPISLLEANFALWLPEPEMWRLRLEAHPTRTDIAPADAGILRVEGTLGKAESLVNVPINLKGEWSAAPLGAASLLLLGHDGGLRGEMTLLATAKGTVGQNDLITRLELRRLRRSEFVPSRTLDLDVNCKAQTALVFHQLSDLRCTWPPDADQTGLGSLVLTGDIPNVRQLQNAQLEARFTNVPASGALDLLREISQRVAPQLEAGGLVSGELACCDSRLPLAPTGEFTIQHSRLAFDPTPLRPEQDDEITGQLDGPRIALDPIELNLGAPQPAILTIQTDDAGIHLHLTGAALRSRLLAFGKALPQFGDGLAAALTVEPPARTDPTAKTAEAPVRLDLIANRPWNAGQTWQQARPAAPVRKPHRGTARR